MVYSAYKLNKQGDNIQSWCTPFPILNQSVVPCKVLTVASWLAYRFLSLKDFEHYLANMWNELNCMVVWTFFDFVFLWDRNETDLFQSCGHCWRFQIWKGVCQGCILSPCLFNLYADYIMQNAWLIVAQAGIKTAGRNINNLRYADDTTLMAESEEELKSLWWKWKRNVKKLA